MCRECCIWDHLLQLLTYFSGNFTFVNIKGDEGNTANPSMQFLFETFCYFFLNTKVITNFSLGKNNYFYFYFYPPLVSGFLSLLSPSPCFFLYSKVCCCPCKILYAWTLNLSIFALDLTAPINNEIASWFFLSCCLSYRFYVSSSSFKSPNTYFNSVFCL